MNARVRRSNTGYDSTTMKIGIDIRDGHKRSELPSRYELPFVFDAKPGDRIEFYQAVAGRPMDHDLYYRATFFRRPVLGLFGPERIVLRVEGPDMKLLSDVQERTRNVA